MPPQPIRRFTLVDAMILVAAAALGFAGVRAELTRHFHPSVTYLERPRAPTPQIPAGTFAGARTTVTATFERTYPFSIAGPISGLGGYSARFSRMQEWAASARLAVPCLASLSLAMLAIQLRRPRPPWGRLIRQAGTVAGVAATFALGLRLCHALLKLLLEYINPTMLIYATWPRPSRSSWIVCQTTDPSFIGVVVLTSWIVLALGGRHRERGWINRGGIAVGLGWVASLVVDLFLNEAA